MYKPIEATTPAAPCTEDLFEMLIAQENVKSILTRGPDRIFSKPGPLGYMLLVQVNTYPFVTTISGAAYTNLKKTINEGITFEEVCCLLNIPA
jgi:hypothetical protein